MRLPIQSQPVLRAIPSQPSAIRDTEGEQGTASRGCGVQSSGLEDLLKGMGNLPIIIDENPFPFQPGILGI